MSARRRSGVPAVLVAVLLTTVGCGGGGSSRADPDPDRDSDSAGPVGGNAAADTTVCQAQATAVPTPYDPAFPTAWTFPPDTTAYTVEDRAGSGVIVTAISSTSFADILDFLNHDEVDHGFKITEGETEDRDAEANWDAGHYRGRWAIRESATCPGETVIQVVAVPAS